MAIGTNNSFSCAITFLIILSGQWKNVGVKKRFWITVYEKVKFLPMATYVISNILFISSVIHEWQCKSNVVENFFCFLRELNAILVTLMLNSNESETVRNFVFNYETGWLNMETRESQKVYGKVSKYNKNIVLIFTFHGVFASVVWLVSQRR